MNIKNANSTSFRATSLTLPRLNIMRRTIPFSNVLLFIVLATLVPGQTLQDYSSRYCCHQSVPQLEKLYGLHKRCPDDKYVIPAERNKCEKCPRGTCRFTFADGTQHCYCPSSFIADPYPQSKCEFQFKAEWPQSVGKPNVFLKSCALTTSNTSVTTIPSDNTAPENGPDSVQDQSGSTNTGNPESARSLLLSPEVIAAIVGGIFAVFAALLTALCVRKWKKRNNEISDEPHSITYANEYA